MCSAYRPLRQYLLQSSITTAVLAGAVLVGVRLSLTVAYESLVHLSIGLGLAVSLLLLLAVSLSGNVSRYTAFFILGILLMILALLSSDLPTRAVLLSIRHFALAASLLLSGLYTLLYVVQRTDMRVLKGFAFSVNPRLKPYSDFASVFCTTISSELCSCLHPALALDILGISLLIPSQVQAGFILVLATFAYQLRATVHVLCARARPWHSASSQDPVTQTQAPPTSRAPET